jgi:hypothetical protein
MKTTSWSDCCHASRSAIGKQGKRRVGKKSGRGFKAEKKEHQRRTSHFFFSSVSFRDWSCSSLN